MTPEAARALADAGSFAVLIFVLGVVGVVLYKLGRGLINDHLRADQDDRSQRDHALELLKVSNQTNLDNAQANRELAAAWNRMVDVLERKIRADAERQRRTDPK